MTQLLLFVSGIAIAVLGAVGLWLAARRKRIRRRQRLLALPAPPEWEPILRRNVPICARLPVELKARLVGLMHVFLDEKRFEGCGDLELTDEIRVTVAAQACILLLGGAGRFFPQMRSIFVYPAAYVPDGDEREGFLMMAGQPRLGESWHRGPVVLSWDAASRRVGQARGHNLVFHEFAHQLDSEDGAPDGAPALPAAASYAEWSKVFYHELEALRRRVSRGQTDVMDEYGAKNPAEFFAVATEAFFERSIALRDRHPDVYRLMKSYFHLDPAEWA